MQPSASLGLKSRLSLSPSPAPSPCGIVCPAGPSPAGATGAGVAAVVVVVAAVVVVVVAVVVLVVVVVFGFATAFFRHGCAFVLLCRVLQTGVAFFAGLVVAYAAKAPTQPTSRKMVSGSIRRSKRYRTWLSFGSPRSSLEVYGSWPRSTLLDSRMTCPTAATATRVLRFVHDFRVLFDNDQAESRHPNDQAPTKDLGLMAHHHRS